MESEEPQIKSKQASKRDRTLILEFVVGFGEQGQDMNYQNVY